MPDPLDSVTIAWRQSRTTEEVAPAELIEPEPDHYTEGGFLRMMNDQQPVAEHMKLQVQDWIKSSDRRAIFLECYWLMTQNMLAAVAAGEFHDGEWANSLLHRFAEYYFDALELYERDDPETPAVWSQAHDAAAEPETMVMQNLLLGVNAHINYDLVFALADTLEREWDDLPTRRREQRYADHCHVNIIIGQTVDSVQDQIIERWVPAMGIVDVVLGPVDEWITSHLIAHWRDEVWERAVRLMATRAQDKRERFRQQVEDITLKRADVIVLDDVGSVLTQLI